MKTLTFVRHAQSFANAGGITMPNEAIPLSELGLGQAEQLATLWPLAPTAILASGMVRAQQTAAPLCKRFNLTVQIAPALNEISVIDPALLQGLNMQQRKPFTQEYWSKSDPHQRCGPQADTFIEFAARVHSFIGDMDKLPDGTAFFGHGIWCALLHWILTGHTAQTAADMTAFREFELAFDLPNCGLVKLTHKEQESWQVGAVERLIQTTD